MSYMSKKAKKSEFSYFKDYIFISIPLRARETVIKRRKQKKKKAAAKDNA